MSKEVHSFFFFLLVIEIYKYLILSSNRWRETSSQVSIYKEIIEDTHNMI